MRVLGVWASNLLAVEIFPSCPRFPLAKEGRTGGDVMQDAAFRLGFPIFICPRLLFGAIGFLRVVYDTLFGTPCAACTAGAFQCHVFEKK